MALVESNFDEVTMKTDLEALKAELDSFRSSREKRGPLPLEHKEFKLVSPSRPLAIVPPLIIVFAV